MGKKAVILDRDGTLVEHVPYLFDPDHIKLLSGVKEGLSTLLANGVGLFLHTNQSGVGRGLFTLDDVFACNGRMIELLELGSDPFLKICIAPESPDEPSHFRKPSPIFAQEVMRDYGFQPTEIWYVGDRGSDLLTAKAAGTHAVGLATGLDDLQLEVADSGLAGVFPIFDNFNQVVEYILNHE